MAKIRFANLPKLINDLKSNDWIIDTFPFTYKERNYTIVFRLYTENDKKPSTYAVASLEFCYADNLENSIFGYLDFYEVTFYSADEFCRFFGIEKGTANRDLFLDFSEIFAPYIPTKRNANPTRQEKTKMAKRCESDNPNAIYCYGLVRNGKSKNGKQKFRRIENDNKAKLRYPDLYEKVCVDRTISFCFTDDESREKTEAEILHEFTKSI